ncbi:MAG: L-rhamnose mutarotase [Microbacteriaceae bacterium]|jgi:L-rhamnose mutarotase|nr:L-rhamnose mutarotase [Microbacteriaceae bacterium]
MTGGRDLTDEAFEFRTALAPGLGEAYEEFHRAIPAELDAAMRVAGVLEWRIYRAGTTLTHRVVATDRKRMSRVLDVDPVNESWQRQIAPYLAAVPEPAAPADPGILVWDFAWPTR